MITIMLAGGALLFVLVLFVLPPLWRLVRWELAWDWRIAMFGWHAFLFGAALGAVAAFLAVTHWHAALFGH